MVVIAAIEATAAGEFEILGAELNEESPYIRESSNPNEILLFRPILAR